ncbi:MAG: helix-turn-helix domain-containing protein, partial [Usitatibacteraceae bacterium]
MSQAEENARKQRGRPPSIEARSKVMRAARDILMEEGLGKLTVEAVCAKSGVSKPTIYRNWANASELAMAALMIDADNDAPNENRELQSALRAQMRTLVEAFATTRGRQITQTLAASDPESEMSKAFRNRIILSSRENGRR